MNLQACEKAETRSGSVSVLGQVQTAVSENLVDPQTHCFASSAPGPTESHLFLSLYPIFFLFLFLLLTHNFSLLFSSSFSPLVFQSPSPSVTFTPTYPAPPSLTLCLERKRWPLNVSAEVWGSGEQPSHCVTPPWTPDGLMNKGSPPSQQQEHHHLFLHSRPHSLHTRPLVGNSPTSFTGSQTSPAAFD